MMLSEVEYLFSVAVLTKIKQRIRARVFVTFVEGDKLFVKIFREGEFEFKHYIGNITEKIRDGISSDTVAYEVRDKFKQFIMEQYFYFD